MDTIVGGIDVSKDKLDIAVRSRGKVFGTRQDAAGLEAVIARLAPLAPEAVAVETTGGFETVVATSFAAAGLPVVVVNPAQVRSFAQACRKRAKPDPIDAMAIVSDDPDFKYVMIDGTTCLVHQHGAGAKRGLIIRPSALILSSSKDARRLDGEVRRARLTPVAKAAGFNRPSSDANPKTPTILFS